jgi:site-specific recombinase XerD
MGWQDDKQAVMHTFRHTFISRLVQRGVPLVTVKELAGHKTMDMTLRYAHLAPNNYVEAISVLET